MLCASFLLTRLVIYGLFDMIESRDILAFMRSTFFCTAQYNLILLYCSSFVLFFTFIVNFLLFCL